MRQSMELKFRGLARIGFEFGGQIATIFEQFNSGQGTELFERVNIRECSVWIPKRFNSARQLGFP